MVPKKELLCNNHRDCDERTFNPSLDRHDLKEATSRNDTVTGLDVAKPAKAQDGSRHDWPDLTENGSSPCQQRTTWVCVVWGEPLPLCGERRGKIQKKKRNTQKGGRCNLGPGTGTNWEDATIRDALDPASLPKSPYPPMSHAPCPWERLEYHWDCVVLVIARKKSSLRRDKHFTTDCSLIDTPPPQSLEQLSVRPFSFILLFHGGRVFGQPTRSLDSRPTRDYYHQTDESRHRGEAGDGICPPVSRVILRHLRITPVVGAAFCSV